MRVFLTGFMGSGKTAVGLRLARLLGVPFVDLDEEVERRVGMSVRQIFETHGEAAFRQLEQEVLRETVELPEGVVATGGGTFAYESNARLMQAHGRTVFLNPTFSTIVARIGRGKLDRPLFRDDVQALNLYRERLPAYRRADVTVDVAAAESAGEVASRIALLLGAKPCAT